MISRLFRFHGYNSLTAVYKRGATVRGPMISSKYLPRRPGAGYRAAVVVSKKVHKSAVVRNRIRRRVFELIRLDQTSLGDVDIVLTVFSDQVATLPTSQLLEQVTTLLVKINSSTPELTDNRRGMMNAKRNN